MRRMIAKLGSCAFCHKNFIVNQEEILYSKEQRRAWHLGCPPIEMPRQPRSSSAPKPTELPKPAHRIQDTEDHPKAEIESISNDVSALASQHTTWRPNIMTTQVKTDVVESQVLPDLAQLFDGKFSIPVKMKDGTETHVSVRIDTRKADHKFAGSRRIRAHFGRHDGKEFIDVAYIPVNGRIRWYHSFQHQSELTAEKKDIVRKAVELLLAGKENAEYAMEYARICKRCWHCNKDLTSLDTLQKINEYRGLGPICYKKYPLLRNRITSEAIASQPTWITL